MCWAFLSDPYWGLNVTQFKFLLTFIVKKISH